MASKYQYSIKFNNKIRMIQQIETQFEKEAQIYQYILQLKKSEWRKLKPFPAQAAFVTHIVFKAAIFLFIYWQDVFTPIMGQLLNYQIIIVFIVLDFWFVKNYNGRKLLGLRWSFDTDRYGVERFSYQARLNDQFINRIHFQIFWFVQIVHIGYPCVNIYVLFHVQVFIAIDQVLLVSIQLLVFLGGISNLFLFYKAYSCSRKNIHKIKKVYGADFMAKFSKNSIVAHL